MKYILLFLTMNCNHIKNKQKQNKKYYFPPFLYLLKYLFSKNARLYVNLQQ